VCGGGGLLAFNEGLRQYCGLGVLHGTCLPLLMEMPFHAFFFSFFMFSFFLHVSTCSRVPSQVCTAQYFAWYFSFVPLVLPDLLESRNKVRSCPTFFTCFLFF
jgi:hypothetical protein